MTRPPFEFAAPARIVVGDGRVREAGTLAATLGARALVVHGGGTRADAPHGALHDVLRAAGLSTTPCSVSHEPTVALVEAGVAHARAARCDVVVAIGGGSVLDAAKAIAALVTNTAPIRTYLEVVGEGRPLAERPLPVLAIPTTAGTGSEATRNAVLLVEGARVKVSLRSATMLPAIALVDPVLTHALPPDVTASTGMDALTQCLEPFVSPAANALSDAVAREGLRHVVAGLRRAVHSGDPDARRAMALAGLCGGLALANARLGAVHGFAAPLGGMFPVPHGVACARLLAPVTAANVRALRARDAGSPALARYTEVAQLVTGTPDAPAEALAAWLEQLTEELAIPRLATFGVHEGDVAAIVAFARRASSMQGNPVVLDDEELSIVLRAAL